MRGRDYFERLRVELPDIDLLPEVTLTSCGVGGRWIQYLTKEMQSAFGTAIHYEILGWYGGFRVVLHDERCRHDEVWKVLRRIVACHSSVLSMNGDSEITFTQHILESKDGETRCVKDDANALSIMKARLRELFNVFNPFLSQVANAMIRNGEKNIQVVAKQYVIPQDVLMAEEALNRFIATKIPLKLNKDTKMEADSAEGRSLKFSYQIYRGFLDEGDVHFELMVRDSELSVELHDERGISTDKLQRCLKRMSQRYGHIVDQEWNSGISIRLPHSIVSGRTWELIVTDVERDMRTLWSTYGTLLSNYAIKGETSLVDGDMVIVPEMAEIPSPPSVEDGLVPLSNFPLNTFSWVTTVDDLFKHLPIVCVGDEVHLLPGNYVIPVYQRKYAWSEKNVSILCRDLLRAENAQKSSYHLGTLVFHADKKTEEFFVVDGQQRLRTVSRILSQKIFKESDSLVKGHQFSRDDEARIWRTFQRFTLDDQRKILSMLRRSTFVCIAVSDISESFQLFNTQNGRGRQLSPENLLKAFHFHELDQSPKPENVSNDEAYIDNWKDKLDETWEELNGTSLECEDRNLLGQVMGEHLYRIRAWLHNVFPEWQFSSDDVSAFKGLTVRAERGGQRIPLENLSPMRRYADSLSQEERVSRSLEDQMNPFVFIDQPIINGADFFEYMRSCCQAYRNLFLDDGIAELGKFRSWYKKYNLYPCSGRRGDTYARHVFQSLCLYCYDRFGNDGLTECYFELYCCAYYERATNGRCYYHTCGRKYAMKAIQAMASVSTLPDLKDCLFEVSLAAREDFEKSGATSVSGLEFVYEVFDGGDGNV